MLHDQLFSSSYAIDVFTPYVPLNVTFPVNMRCNLLKEMDIVYGEHIRCIVDNMWKCIARSLQSLSLMFCESSSCCAVIHSDGLGPFSSKFCISSNNCHWFVSVAPATVAPSWCVSVQSGCYGQNHSVVVRPLSGCGRLLTWYHNQTFPTSASTSVPLFDYWFASAQPASWVGQWAHRVEWVVSTDLASHL